jgi:hypothetical protein
MVSDLVRTFLQLTDSQAKIQKEKYIRKGVSVRYPSVDISRTSGTKPRGWSYSVRFRGLVDKKEREIFGNLGGCFKKSSF